jgi:hypothetical protein
MKIFRMIFIISVLCVACSDKKSPNEIPVIEVGSNAFNMEKIYLSDYASEIRYVPLEEQKNYLLGSSSFFYADFSDEYILDTDGLKCLLYDRNGNFISQIGSQGRGPGEYTGISSVFLTDNKIFIHDYYLDDIIEYKTDGSFIKNNKSGFTLEDKFYIKMPYFINDSMIIGNYDNRTGQEEYKAFLFDKNGAIIKYYKNYILFNLDIGATGARSGNPIYFRFDDKVFFKERYNDTLFMLNLENQFETCYVFDFAKYKTPLSMRMLGLTRTNSNPYIEISGIQQTDQFLFLECLYGNCFPAYRFTAEKVRMPNGDNSNFTQNNPYVLGLYDKKTGDLVFSEPTDTDNRLYSSGFYNDIDAGPRFMPSKMINDSTMAMKIPFNRLMMHIESDDFKNNIPKNQEQKEKLAALVDSLKKTDFDNPVYMLVTFK